MKTDNSTDSDRFWRTCKREAFYKRIAALLLYGVVSVTGFCLIQTQAQLITFLYALNYVTFVFAVIACFKPYDY